MRRAVVLFNLGGPSGEKDIQPFLFRFFMDKNIITAPLPVRIALAAWISLTRSRGAAKTAYAPLGYKSPLLDNTKKQARALEEKLRDTKVFICMRYAAPRAEEIAAAVKAFAPDEIVLLPLYPQYSTTTTRSAFQDWERAVVKTGLNIPTRKICCWPLNAGFISASADNIKKVFTKAPPKTRLLFSAHGLPEKIIRAGDPYQKQCEKTAAAIVSALNIPGLDWQICYQSRVGRLKWIGPSTDEALEKAAHDKVGAIIYPHAFVSEHVETLVEIDIEYRARAEKLGLPFFAKAETVGTHPDFIAGLAGLIEHAEEKETSCRTSFSPTTTPSGLCTSSP